MATAALLDQLFSDINVISYIAVRTDQIVLAKRVRDALRVTMHR